MGTLGRSEDLGAQYSARGGIASERTDGHRTKTLSIPMLGMIAVTRAMVGAGIGLLVGPKMRGGPRRIIAIALIAVGALGTIPAVMALREQRN